MRRLIVWLRLRLVEIDIGEMKQQLQRIPAELEAAELYEIDLAIELAGLTDKRKTA